MQTLTQHMTKIYLLGLLLLLPGNAAALGDDGVNIEIASTIVGQQISKRNADIKKPGTASIDLIMDTDLGFGTLHLYGEGGSTADVSATTLVGGANGTAGTAATATGKGRFQLSEISFDADLSALNIELGVMDFSVRADETTTASEEDEQFLAEVLTVNASIAFPVYSPGIVVNYGEEDEISFTLQAANAYGLLDNPEASYAQMLKIGKTPTGEKKGLFSLAELRLPITAGDSMLTVGGWHSTKELTRIDGTKNDNNTTGAYINLNSHIGDTAWSVRGGFNNAKTEMLEGVSSFYSLSLEHEITEQHAFGLGLAYSGVRSDFKASLAPNTGANTTVGEIYYRWQITDEIAISPDIQYHHNANNLASATPADVFGNVWVYGLRIQLGTSQQLAHKAE